MNRLDAARRALANTPARRPGNLAAARAHREASPPPAGSFAAARADALDAAKPAPTGNLARAMERTLNPAPLKPAAKRDLGASIANARRFADDSTARTLAATKKATTATTAPSAPTTPSAPTPAQKALVPAEFASQPFIYVAKSTRQLFGVALAPRAVSADVIEATARDFAETYKRHGSKRVKLLQSVIAPEDMNVLGQQIQKGSWILSVIATDDALWGAVQRGEITGFGATELGLSGRV